MQHGILTVLNGARDTPDNLMAFSSAREQVVKLPEPAVTLAPAETEISQELTAQAAVPPELAKPEAAQPVVAPSATNHAYWTAEPPESWPEPVSARAWKPFAGWSRFPRLPCLYAGSSQRRKP